MNLAEAINDLANEMEKDLLEKVRGTEFFYSVYYYIRCMKTFTKSLLSSSVPETTAVLQGTHLPNRTQKPQSLLTAPMHEDPWKGPPLLQEDDDYDPRDPRGV